MNEDARQKVIAAAEARGAALAVEQCRRLAEELIAKSPSGMRSFDSSERCDGYRDGLRALVAALSATPDLAAEVRRIEERGVDKETARAVKLAKEYLEQLRQAGREGWSIALREYVRRLRESAP